ncbi:oxidoreductase family protein [Pyronema domesticum]|nr:oxidoreductase family protein [Pyronema domesticum]
MSSEPIGIALLGTGIFAQQQHLPALLSPEIQARFKLLAIYSRTLISAQNLAQKVPYSVDVYSDETLLELLGRDDIKAVIICLPIPAQPRVIENCLRHKKHVLSEKPIAPSLDEARNLLKTYHSVIPGSERGIWGVAENYRYQKWWETAREEVKGLGKVLGFSVRMETLVEQGVNKYLETTWRKEPTHQGGFLLDGGVHFTAGLRLMLGEEIKTVSALTALTREYLPPVDTVNAVLKTESGVVGTFCVSFGSSRREFEFIVACDGGVVKVQGGGKVTVKKNGEQDRVIEHKEHGNGVKEEIVAFADAILAGKIDENQSPENALVDLELIEKMIQSGEADGKPFTLARK